MHAAVHDNQLLPAVTTVMPNVEPTVRPAAALTAVPNGTAMLAAVMLIFGLAFLRLPESIITLLEYDRSAILSGEVWRLWTGHLVHFSAQHTITDGMALLVAGCVAIRVCRTERFWFHFCWIAPMISVGLLCWSPTLQVYRGLSGLVVALTVLVAAELCRIQASSRPWIALFGMVMVLKTIAEASGIAGDSASLPTGVEVEWRAHVLGAAGAAMGVMWRLLSAKKPRPTRDLSEATCLYQTINAECANFTTADKPT